MDEIRTPPSKSADKFIVRLPDGMRRRIGEVSKRARRSMNSEIVCRLEHSFDTVVDPIAASEMRNMLAKLNPQRKLGIFNDSLSFGDPMAVQLNHLEQGLVTAFRGLSDEKKQSILILLSS